jgi:hypothetical protein
LRSAKSCSIFSEPLGGIQVDFKWNVGLKTELESSLFLKHSLIRIRLVKSSILGSICSICGGGFGINLTPKPKYCNTFFGILIEEKL